MLARPLSDSYEVIHISEGAWLQQAWKSFEYGVITDSPQNGAVVNLPLARGEERIVGSVNGNPPGSILPCDFDTGEV